MIAQTQLKKPSNWQDFEKLCKLLWGEIWSCEDSIKRHGRQGQNQHGVDVFSYVEKYGGYCGIQCKGKDDFATSQHLILIHLKLLFSSSFFFVLTALSGVGRVKPGVC